MGVATGCGFKEIYRFPHTTYPYSSCICTFLQQHPYFFVHFFKCFSFFNTSCGPMSCVSTSVVILYICYLGLRCSWWYSRQANDAVEKVGGLKRDLIRKLN